MPEAVAEIEPAPNTERSLSLYEHLELMDLAAQSDESDESDAALREFIQAEIAQATTDKIERIHHVFVSLDMVDAAVDAEIERLRGRKESNARIRERIRQNVQYAMEAHGVKKIAGRTVTFSLRAKPGGVVIVDEASVPARFKSVTATLPLELWTEIVASWNDTRIVEAIRNKSPDTTISRTAVKQALNAGEEVDGADMSFGGTSLVVK